MRYSDKANTHRRKRRLW